MQAGRSYASVSRSGSNYTNNYNNTNNANPTTNTTQSRYLSGLSGIGDSTDDGWHGQLSSWTPHSSSLSPSTSLSTSTTRTAPRVSSSDALLGWQQAQSRRSIKQHHTAPQSSQSSHDNFHRSGASNRSNPYIQQHHPSSHSQYSHSNPIQRPPQAHYSSPMGRPRHNQSAVSSRVQSSINAPISNPQHHYQQQQQQQQQQRALPGGMLNISPSLTYSDRPPVNQSRVLSYTQQGNYLKPYGTSNDSPVDGASDQRIVTSRVIPTHSSNAGASSSHLSSGPISASSNQVAESTSKGPKKTKHVSLFDLIRSPKTIVNPGAALPYPLPPQTAQFSRPPSLPTTVPHSGAATTQNFNQFILSAGIDTGNHVMKGFVVTNKKRKKKLTTIKKRILVERMRYNARRQLESDARLQYVISSDGEPAKEQTVGDILASRYSAYSVLKLCGFVEESELQDDDERAEIISNVKSMFADCGVMKDILIGSTFADAIVDSVPKDVDRDSMPDEETAENGFVPLYLYFESFPAARMACSMATGLVIGGSKITSFLCNASNLTDQLALEPLELKSEIVDQNDKITSVTTFAISQSLEAKFGVIIIGNLVSDDDVQDESEVAELLSDIQGLCDPDRLLAVWIASKEALLPRLDVIDAVPLQPYDMLVEFTSVEQAKLAQLSLQGLVVGGEEIIVRLYDHSAYLRNQFDERFITVDQDYPVSDTGAVVLISNYWTEDDNEAADFDNIHADYTSFIASKHDLLELISQRVGATKDSLGIMRITTVGLAMRKEILVSQDEDQSSKLWVVGAVLASQSAAIDTMVRLDGSVCGGKHLTANVVPILNDSPKPVQWVHGFDESYLRSLFAGSPAPDANEAQINESIEQLRPLIRPLVGKIFPAVGSTLEDKERLPSTTDGEVPTENSAATGVKGEEVKDIKGALPTRLELLRTTPKLSKHDGALESSLKIATEEIDSLIKEMIGSLATFQARAKELDPIKAKQKQRFVVGLKQVLNGVKAGRAKLILLSPDTECSDALDDKLDAVISEAAEKEIPILYCLSRRKMGKAIGLTTRQSALAVYDASGAYEQFKKVVNFVSA